MGHLIRSPVLPTAIADKSRRNPGEWRKGVPGYNLAIADVIAADRLGPADPDVREALKWGPAAIREAEQRRK